MSECEEHSTMDWAEVHRRLHQAESRSAMVCDLELAAYRRGLAEGLGVPDPQEAVSIPKGSYSWQAVSAASRCYVCTEPPHPDRRVRLLLTIGTARYRGWLHEDCAPGAATTTQGGTT